MSRGRHPARTCYRGGDTPRTRWRAANRVRSGRPHCYSRRVTRAQSEILGRARSARRAAPQRPARKRLAVPVGQNCPFRARWHVGCSMQSPDTGIRVALSAAPPPGDGSRGGSEIQSIGRFAQRSAPPSARVLPRHPTARSEFEMQTGPKAPGLVPESVPSDGPRECRAAVGRAARRRDVRSEEFGRQQSVSSDVETAVTKKLNTPGQRSREARGVHPGHSLISREEAAGVEERKSFALLAAFSHLPRAGPD